MQNTNVVDKYIRLKKGTPFFEPNQMHRDIMPFMLYPDAQFQTGAMVVNAAGTPTNPFIYKNPHASIGLGHLGNPININRIVFEDSTDTTDLADFTVMLKDMGDITQFMNRPIHVRTFAGTAQLPAGLSEPLLLPTRHQLQLTCAKVAGGAVNMRLFFGGAIYYTWSTELAQYPEDRAAMFALVEKYLERRRYIYPFWLTPEAENGVVVGANQTVQVDALIGDDGHFEATHWMAKATSDRFEVEIFNPDTKQSLSNGAIQKGAIIGNAQNPEQLPSSYLVPAGERIRFKFTDLSGSENRIFFTFRGLKIRAPIKSIQIVKNDTRVSTPTQNKPIPQRMIPVGAK